MTKKLYLLPTNPKGHTNPRGKRTFEQRERDLWLEADLYLKHRSLEEIRQAVIALYAGEGIEMSISLPTIHADLDEIHTRWINSSLVDFDLAKGKELAAWDTLEKAYWEAWSKSLEAKTVDEMQTIFDEVAFAADQVIPVKRTKARHKVETRDGSAVFLQGVAYCIEARCKILGLFSPERFQVDWRVEAKRAGIDEKTAGEMFEEMVGTIQKALGSGEE